jgi:hypothetical protein
MGAALLTFTVTGFWLWYGPKRFRAHSRFHRDAAPSASAGGKA